MLLRTIRSVNVVLMKIIEWFLLLDFILNQQPLAKTSCSLFKFRSINTLDYQAKKFNQLTFTFNSHKKCLLINSRTLVVVVCQVQSQMHKGHSEDPSRLWFDRPTRYVFHHCCLLLRSFQARNALWQQKFHFFEGHILLSSTTYT